MGRLMGVLSLVALGLLALAASAGAAITSSQITSPASPAFATWNQNEPSAIEVTGTTAGAIPGDKVDIDCYAGGEVKVLEGGVGVAGNGTFFVASASLEKAASRICRLRAVPAGTTPADPTPFAGPLVAVGQRHVEIFPPTPPVPAVNRPFGFSFTGQQLSAADTYRSLGRCGIVGLLDDAALEQTTTTFSCADRLWRFDDYDEPVDSTRSQIQIDGANAYTAASTDESFGGTEHFPAISFSASLNPLTGDVVVHDDETLVICPTPAYEEACTVASGVRVERTIEQTADGHLVTVTDRYSSTDGQAHSLDLLPENVQQFAGKGEKHAPAIAYRFPGQAAFSTHVSGDVVPFPDASPGMVEIRVEGAPDGDQSTGLGAIVFDRPASPAKFNLLENEERSGFEFHQTATVPASGSTSFRAAYVQGYGSAEVESLVARAEAAFQPAIPPAVTPAAPPTAGPPIVPATIRLLKDKLDKRDGTATVLASVSGPGRLRLTGKGLATTTATSHGAGAVKLAVRPKGRTRTLLAARGKARVKVTVTFSPAGGGSVTTATRSITLKETPRRRRGG